MKEGVSRVIKVVGANGYIGAADIQQVLDVKGSAVDPEVQSSKQEETGVILFFPEIYGYIETGLGDKGSTGHDHIDIVPSQAGVQAVGAADTPGAGNGKTAYRSGVGTNSGLCHGIAIPVELTDYLGLRVKRDDRKQDEGMYNFYHGYRLRVT